MNQQIRKPAVLITGANGEMGHGLIERLAAERRHSIIAIDLRPLEDEIRSKCSVAIAGDILDARLLERLHSEFEIRSVYHLAALLSTRAEFTPEAAHRVNVEGTISLLKRAGASTPRRAPPRRSTRRRLRPGWNRSARRR